MKVTKKIVSKDPIVSFVVEAKENMGSHDDYKSEAQQLYREMCFIEKINKKVKIWFEKCPDGSSCPRAFWEYVSKIVNDADYDEIVVVENDSMAYEIKEINGKLYSSLKKRTD